MPDHDFLGEQFEAHRGHLRAVAYRMLGSEGEAEDAVQEAWLRLSRSDTTEVENLGGWLTTVVARVCLDMLRSRKSRREDPFEDDTDVDAAALSEPTAGDPEREALLADSVGPALLVILDTLAPAERLAFVLHDMFAVPFDDIAQIVGRSPAAARQLASRGRRRVQGLGVTPDAAADRARRRTVVEAFFAAAREGNFEALLAVLDPDVVMRGDGKAVELGVAAETRNAVGVANFFKGRAAAARAALVDGIINAVWAPGNTPRVVFQFTIVDGKIIELDLIANPERLQQMDVQILPILDKDQ